MKRGGHKRARNAGQLAELAALWPKLPAAVRRDILKLVKGAAR